MGYRPEHSEETKRRILESAGRLFRSKGFDAASIDEIMAGAGLTRGGFYQHFESKADLFAEFVGQEPVFAKQLRAGREGRPEDPEVGAWEAVDYYLSPENRGRIGRGCTIVANAADVARSSKKARVKFTEAFEDLQAEFAALASERADDPDASALAAIATCVGGVVLARALSKPDLIESTLSACRSAVRGTLGAERA